MNPYLLCLFHAGTWLGTCSIAVGQPAATDTTQAIAIRPLPRKTLFYWNITSPIPVGSWANGRRSGIGANVTIERRLTSRWYVRYQLDINTLRASGQLYDGVINGQPYLVNGRNTFLYATAHIGYRQPLARRWATYSFAGPGMVSVIAPKVVLDAQQQVADFRPINRIYLATQAGLGVEYDFTTRRKKNGQIVTSKGPIFYLEATWFYVPTRTFVDRSQIMTLSPNFGGKAFLR